MANSKKYVSLDRLSDFLDNLKNMFLRKDEYIVDDSLSANSSNPVKNSAICTEFNNYYAKSDIDEMNSQKSQVQIIYWDSDDSLNDLNDLEANS